MAKDIFSMLSFNDPHFTLVAPISRTSSYPKDIIKKILEVIKLAKKLGVKYVGCSGDWMHRKGAASSKEGYILLWLLQYAKSLGIEIIGILGNHDIPGYNLDARINRPIGMIAKSGLLRLLDFNPIIKDDIKIVGTSFHHNYDVSRQAYFKSEKDMKKFTIAFTHGSLVLKNKGTFWGPYTNLNHLKEHDGTLHDVIINGHLHHNQNSATIKERKRVVKIFANGSLARNILKEDVAKRIPTVLYLRVKSDMSVVAEQIPLRCAKPFEKAFIMPEDMDGKVYGQDISDFVHELIKESEDFSVSNDKMLVEKIIKKKKFSKRVETKVLAYLEEKECSGEDH